jgi:hypothetical protein
MDLTKADRKVAREIIEKGLQQEYTSGLEKSLKVLTDWKAGKKTNREAYQELYSHIYDYDKHIARRYDNMSGSKYLFIIAGQIIDKVVDESEIERLSPDACEFVQRILYLNKKS